MKSKLLHEFDPQNENSFYRKLIFNHEFDEIAYKEILNIVSWLPKDVVSNINVKETRKLIMFVLQYVKSVNNYILESEINGNQALYKNLGKDEVFNKIIELNTSIFWFFDDLLGSPGYPKYDLLEK